MSNTYCITIYNHSGKQCKYALFNKVPEVTGGVQGKIWGTVFATGNVLERNSIRFKMSNRYSAFVGSSDGKPTHNASMNIGDNKEVTLGTKTASGVAVPGTTLEFVVEDDVPQFSKEALPNSSHPSAFEVRTGDFDAKQAEKGKYMIGLCGTSSRGPTPVSAFCLEPNSTYRIQPTNVYYIAIGSFQSHTLFDLTMIGPTTEVDFNKLNDDVTYVHDTHNVLTLEKD